MSSKLHHRGSPQTEAVVWEPPSKGGTTVVRPANAAAQPQQRQDVDLRAEQERQIREQVQAAHQRGVAEGEASGRQQATAQFNSALEKVARSIEDLASFKPRMRHEAEQDVVKLSMAIARRILYRELSTDPAALLGLVRSALDKLDSREIQRVRVNPQDAPVVQQHLQQMGTGRKIEVLADGGLQRGSAVFETSHGSLDASADTQLNEIERGFTDLMKRGPV